MEDGLGVFACYFEVLYLLLLSLLVVYVDLEGSLVHRFCLLGSLLEVVRLPQEVLTGVESLLLYPEGDLLLEGLLHVVDRLLLLPLRL